MRVLVAFDKFKDSMTANQACESASKGIRAALGNSIKIEQTPLTDGGEGFCPILTKAVGGALKQYTVSGPLGEKRNAPIGWAPAKNLPEAIQSKLQITGGQIAIIEMASAAGLEQVPPAQRHPNNCTTYGVGELIGEAHKEGATAILLGIGGSATSDLGIGALCALGLKLFDSSNSEVEKSTPTNWPDIARLNTTRISQLPPIFIACDVDNPLTGPNGAATIYGPQKGLMQAEIDAFDRGTSHIGKQLCDAFKQPHDLCDTPGSGAAGGLGFGLKVAFNATFLPGFDLVTSWLDLKNKIKSADFVLSGEGKIDCSSLAGKGPVALTNLANKEGTNSALLAGKITPEAESKIKERFQNCRTQSITPPRMPLPQALAQGQQNLEKAVERLLL